MTLLVNTLHEQILQRSLGIAQCIHTNKVYALAAMTIRLPTQPNGYQFEEAVAAQVRSLGYFTENRTVLDHVGRSVLELDVVASPSSPDFLNRILIDAKKESTGFADIFKVYGWRTFLGIPRGCIVHGAPMDERALLAFNEMCPKLTVYANQFDITSNTKLEAIPSINKLGDEHLQQTAFAVGWYEMIADRLTLEDFYTAKKKHEGEALFNRIHKYRRACQLAFFEPDPLKRVNLLYAAYKEDAGITESCLGWQALQLGRGIEKIADEVRDTSNFFWIQHVMALETRARILIIKNGIEACLSGNADLSNLPINFQRAFEIARKDENRTAIPFILQIYVELFGGYLVDDTDVAQLAALAAVPIAAVNRTLDLFDVFYPTNNGWRFKSKELKMMKNIPAYLHGIGSLFRFHSRKLKEYSSVAPQQQWLLANWHQAVFALLEKELGVKEGA